MHAAASSSSSSSKQRHATCTHATCTHATCHMHTRHASLPHARTPHADAAAASSSSKQQQAEQQQAASSGPGLLAATHAHSSTRTQQHAHTAARTHSRTRTQAHARISRLALAATGRIRRARASQTHARAERPGAKSAMHSQKKEAWPQPRLACAIGSERPKNNAKQRTSKEREAKNAFAALGCPVGQKGATEERAHARAYLISRSRVCPHLASQDN